MLKHFFKMKYDVYLLYFLLLFLEFFVFSLLHLSLEIWLYFLFVSISIIVIYTIISYFRFIKKHKELENIDVFIHSLKSNHLIEEDYIHIIDKLVSDLKEIKRYDYNKYNDMIEYYTIWVHQIKTPISALKLIIQTENDNRMMVELLKIEQYVNMVLQYLRLDHIHNDLSFQYYSLDKMVSEVLKKQVSFFSLSKISLNYHIEDINILTDEKWCSFVIEQILSNAIKYTKKGSIEIYNDKEKLYIKDTGIGIRSEDLPRVFEKGFTGYNGRMDKKASGIGLYLTKQILDLLGNTMTIESSLDKGTAVCIDFYKEKTVLE